MSFASIRTGLVDYTIPKAPVSKPIPNTIAQQAVVPGGTFTFQTNKWDLFNRFLVLGSASSKYNSTAHTTPKSLGILRELLEEDGKKVVDTIVAVSSSGRAKNNDYALLALAMTMSLGNAATKHYAGLQLENVARTGTHILHFCNFVNDLRGWGSSLKKAVANWYSKKTPDQVAYQYLKYQSRDGWSQRDILRLAHPHAQGDVLRNSTYRYIARGAEGLTAEDKVPKLIEAYEQAKTARVPTLIKLIIDNRMSHEMIPNEMKNNPAVWEALSQHMGLWAMVRNLNKFTSLGMVGPNSALLRDIVQKLTDNERIIRERVHPLTVLIAQRQYSKGYGDKGSLTWTPIRDLINSLEYMFYASFQAIETTGKNFLLGVDISGSMGGACTGEANITCREAATVMAMVTARREPNSRIYGFDHQFRNLNITPDDTLAQATAKVTSMSFGATNPSLAIKTALDNSWDIDCFAFYTDNEVNQGTHPSIDLKRYRKLRNKPNAKMVVAGMRVNDFTLADPTDGGMLDVVGFDSAAPAIISQFVAD